MQASAQRPWLISAADADATAEQLDAERACARTASASPPTTTPQRAGMTPGRDCRRSARRPRPHAGCRHGRAPRGAMTQGDDRFLSAEDNDLRQLPDEEFWAWWRLWFRAAQASNADDEHLYSHGVFTVEPGYEHLEAQQCWT